MGKSRLFATFGTVIVLGALLYAGPSILQVYLGGTGATSFTAHGVLIGEGSSPISAVSLSAHQIAIGQSSADPVAKTIPDCQDSGGNHLNYTQSTDAFSCGTSSSGGGSTVTVNVPFDACVPAQTTNGGNSWNNTQLLTNVDIGTWEFLKAATADIYCYKRISRNLSGTTGSIILDLQSADTTSAHTVSFQTCDVITSSGNLQVGSLACASSQNYAPTSTAYANTELTFSVQATLSANQILVVKIHQASGASNTSDVIMPPPMLQVAVTGAY